jgi:hypothetical protein
MQAGLTSSGIVATRAYAPRLRRYATAFDCAGVFVLACALRMVWLDHQPLWTDELFSVYWSQLDPGFLVGEGARLETNPPAYYLLLHGWIDLFGTSAFAVRLPSVLFSSATVLVVYAIGRVLLDRTAARLAGLFAALSPVAIFFAQEARTYALLALCCSLALLALAGYANRLAATGTRSWCWLALFVGSAVAAFLLHYTALVFIGACFGAIGLWLVTTRPFPRGEALVWLAAGAVIALAILSPLLTSISLSGSANIAWMQPPNVPTIAAFFITLLVFPNNMLTLVVFVGVVRVVFSVAAASRGLGLDRARFGVLVLIPGLFILLLIGVSVWRPILAARVGMWLTIPLCLVLARAATAHPVPRTRALAATVIALYFLAGIGQYYGFVKTEDWPASVRLVDTEPRCGGPIVSVAGKGFGLLYYGPPPPDRPLYSMALNDAGRGTALFVLNQLRMHPGILDVEAVADFARTRPGTAVLIHEAELKMAPASLKATLESAPFQRALAGGIYAFCF